MRAWQVRQYGEPEQALVLGETELPEPGPGEMRLQVQTAALGLPDVMMCRGDYEFRPELPFTPGQEVCGIVEAVGEGVSYSPGDRLMAITAFYQGYGGFAGQAMTDQAMAYPVPVAMSDTEAAGFVIPFHTAWAALVERAALAEGETLLVLGAAGGSGSAAVQLGHALGARVIAVAGGTERSEGCRDHGADEVIDHHQADFVDSVQRLTENRGADVVFDPVGGEFCRRSAKCLASGGRILLVGFASGGQELPDARRILLANGSIMGVFVGGWPPEGRLSMHEKLLELYAAGKIRPTIGAEIGFDEVPAGLEALANRRGRGKLVARITS
jgi:NADPH2:quinone reductase